MSTIQQIPGHSDLRTTIIYTHTVKTRTIKEVVSPLDFTRDQVAFIDAAAQSAGHPVHSQI